MTEQHSEWGPWIEHDGKGCPCVGHYVDVFGQSSFAGDYTGSGWCQIGAGWLCCFDWGNYGKLVNGAVATRIIRYRIRRPKGMAILNAILADLPAPVSPVKTDGAIA